MAEPSGLNPRHKPKQLAWRRVVELGAWQALFGYVLITLIAMWPAVSDMSNTIMGSIQPSDATAGGVWLTWSFHALTPFTAQTSMIGAPFGGHLWYPTFITGMGWVLPMWLLAHVTNAIAAWNVLVFVGFLADAMAMFGLVRWVTKQPWIAFVGGVLYAYSPFHVEQSYVHIGYLDSWIFPLIVWACLAFLSCPTRRRAAVLGGLVGISAYLDGYYIVFAPILVGVILVVGFAWTQQIQVLRRRLVEGSGIAACVAGIIMLPVLAVTETSSGLVDQLFAQYRTPSVTSVDPTSARIHAYLVPWDGSPSWAHVVTSLGGRPAFLWGDGSLYLGLSLMAVSAALLAVAIFRPKLFPELSVPLSVRFLAVLLPLATFIVALFSIAHFGPIWGFPRILWAIKPFWRSYSRMYVAIDAVLVLAATLCLALLCLKRRWIAVATAVLFLADATAIFPWASWSFAAHISPSLSWLAHRRDGATFIGYPITPFPNQNAYFLTFQVVVDHPMVNGTRLVHAGAIPLDRGLEALADPQTVPALRRLKVRYVDLETANPGAPWPHVSIPGIRLVFSGGGDRVYRVLPGPIAPAIVTIDSDLTDRALNILVTDHWMDAKTAGLDIDAFVRHREFRVSFFARSSYDPSSGRFLRVIQGNGVLWEGHVGRAPRLVSFVAKSDARLVLKVNPGPTSYPGIVYPRAVEVSGFSVRIA